MQEIQENSSLKSLNTFGLDVSTKYLVPFNSIGELREVVQSDVYKNHNHVVLGGGSNILFTKNVEGLVLKNEILGKEAIRQDENYVWVKFGAGEIWHDCVQWAIEKNLGGIENLSLIPGSMGASPMQNIGAYGVEVKSVVESVEAFEKETTQVRIFSNDDCCFGYRESIFKHSLKDKYIITSVTLRLQKEHELKLSYGAIQNELEVRGIARPTIKDVSDVVIAIRQSKLPNPEEIGNAGSFFKNPVISKDAFEKLQAAHPEIPYYEQLNGIKIPAGWLIEQAGWKGLEEGGIGVHKKQALVLVNYGKGAGLDIYNLSERIINDVKTRYGIGLQREVNVL